MIGGDPVVFLVGALFLIPALLLAIPVHELGHGLAAYAMGDPSPRNRGFFRPDPRRLLNVYGVVAVFLANVGWGNPIPVNEYRLRGGAGRQPSGRHRLRRGRPRPARDRCTPQPLHAGPASAGPAEQRRLRDLLLEPVDIRLPAPPDPWTRRLAGPGGALPPPLPALLLQRIGQRPDDLDRLRGVHLLRSLPAPLRHPGRGRRHLLPACRHGHTRSVHRIRQPASLPAVGSLLNEPAYLRLRGRSPRALVPDALRAPCALGVPSKTPRPPAAGGSATPVPWSPTPSASSWPKNVRQACWMA